MKIEKGNVFTDGRKKVMVTGFNIKKDVQFKDEEGRPATMKRMDFIQAYKPYKKGNPYKAEQKPENSSIMQRGDT